MSTPKNLIVLCVLLLPSTLSLLVPGYFGASDEMHIGWLHQMHRALSLGQFPPRFAPDLVYGFGYPLFNFVFPLPFYIGSVVHFLGFSLVDSIKFVLGLSLFLSGLTMYWSVRAGFGPPAAFLAAVIYVYTPYRATDVYVRGAVGESLAFVFLPLVLGSIVRISQSPQLKHVTVGALGISGLVLSHNITAYMAAGPFALLVLFILKTGTKLLYFLLTAAAGLLMSAYFWFPAIADSPLMRHDTVFDFTDHFPTLAQLFKPNWGWGASVPGPHDGMSFFLGFGVLASMVGLLLTVPASTDRGSRGLVLWVLAVFLTSIFFMNHRSASVWNILPFIEFFQFPWRFLTLTTLVGAVAAAAVTSCLRLSLGMTALISLLVIGLEIHKFRPNDFLGRTDAYYLDRYIPLPTASALYRQTSTQYLRLPINAQVAPFKNYPLFTCAPACQLEIIDPNPIAAKARIISEDSVIVSFNKLSFPGWNLKINPPAKTELGVGQYGQLLFTLPPGEYQILAKFGQTARNSFLLAVSLSAFAAVLFPLIKTKNI